MAERSLKLGVAGLGRAFMLMLPTFAADRRIALVGAADPRPEARDRFSRDFAAPAYASVEALCAARDVEAVYIATPHQFHLRHVLSAVAHGKHVMVEKPMALTIEECKAMIEAADRSKVRLLVGHSHSFDAPYLLTRRLIEGGAFGGVRMITAINYTDYLYRPRREEELATDRGGGVVFSQAAHQADVVRLLGGGRVSNVRAATGSWDRSRPTEGAYSAILTFEGGAFASMTYSGYGHFDTDELSDWVGEMGEKRQPDQYGAARAALGHAASPQEEAALKAERAYGAVASRHSDVAGPPDYYNHFGLVIASCEHADLRPTPSGVMIYADQERRFEPLPKPVVPRSEVVDELYEAVVLNGVPRHSGAWGQATLEVCLAILSSSQSGGEITLEHQIPWPGGC